MKSNIERLNVHNGRKADVDEAAVRATTIVVIRAGIFIAGLVALSGCSDGCSTSEVSRADSPDGVHSAVMFQRDCGATTGFSTQISLIEPGDKPSGSGNTFRADADHRAAATGDWSGPWAEMRWLAPNHLLIRYAAKSRLFEQEIQVSGVKISYQQVAR